MRSTRRCVFSRRTRLRLSGREKKKNAFGGREERDGASCCTHMLLAAMASSMDPSANRLRMTWS